MTGGRLVVFLSGADELQLEAGGRVYHPGDTIQISDAARASLARTGHRFGAVSDKPPPPAPPAPPPPLVPAQDAAAELEARAAEVERVRLERMPQPAPVAEEG